MKHHGIAEARKANDTVQRTAFSCLRHLGTLSTSCACVHTVCFHTSTRGPLFVPMGILGLLLALAVGRVRDRRVENLSFGKRLF